MKFETKPTHSVVSV